jgi:protein TonB
MAENLTLKIAVSISLAIHLLFLGIASSLFQDSKILRMPTRYVKVTLLPRVTKEKANAKIILPVPLKTGNQDREGPAFDREGLHQAPLFTHPSIINTISFEEPKPISKNKEEEEISSEPSNRPMASGSTLDANSNLRNEGNTVSSQEAILNGGNLSIFLPSIHSEEEGGNVFSYGRSGTGLGSGTGSGNGNSSKGGSGKGTGISGKFFYALRAGNGARPRYAENPKPVYPQEAKEKGYEGEVVLRVELLINGRVGQIEIKKSSGYELLDHSALAAVKQWRFIPAKKDDVAIPLWVNIPIKFQLQ